MNRVTNEKVLEKAVVDRKLLQTNAIRQFNFLGHIIRKEELECFVLQGLIQGGGVGGRQGETCTDRIKCKTGVTACDIFQLARNKKGWRSMVTKAFITQGT